jgi:hypothetical protein
VCQRLGELGRVFPAARAGGGGVVLHDPERVELGGQLQAGVVERAERLGHLRQAVRPAELLGRELPAWDEARDEAGRRLERRGHRWRDAELRSPRVRDALGLAVDPEQCRVLAGEPHHVVAPAEPRAEVAIGDPTAQGRHGTLAGAQDRGHAGHHLGELRDGYLLVHRRPGAPDAGAGTRSEAMGVAGRLSRLPPRRCAHAPGLHEPPCSRRPGRWRVPVPRVAGSRDGLRLRRMPPLITWVKS